MSRYIDADAVTKILEEYMCMFPDCYVAEKMSKAPSIDIVRCKECEHWQTDKFFCKMFHVGTPEDGYCYMAKRERHICRNCKAKHDCPQYNKERDTWTCGHWERSDTEQLTLETDCSWR